MRDQDGNLMPRKVSELIADLQAILENHGDLIVWLKIDYLGYDDNESENAPLSDPPRVVKKNSITTVPWWNDEYETIVLLDADG